MLIRKSISLFIFTTVIAMTISGAITTDADYSAAELSPKISPTPAPDRPPYTAYKGVAIGTKSEVVKTRLGTPKETSDAQDFFVISDHETVQVYYDAAKSVTAISVTYTGKLEGAPSAKDVFGENAETKPDGSITKMVRYPKAGFWISYINTGGDDPLIMVAMQKM
ncbi:MAG: hypothetical protein ABIV48_07235 [Pyrinomonadaceae bacterium]